MVVLLRHSLAEPIAEEVHCLRISLEFAYKVARIRYPIPKIAPMLAITDLLEEVREDDMDQLPESAAVSPVPLEKGIFLERR